MADKNVAENRSLINAQHTEKKRWVCSTTVERINNISCPRGGKGTAIMNTKTKRSAHAGHRGPRHDDQTPNTILHGLMERNLNQIAQCARANGLPENSAVFIQFTGSHWNAYCVDIDSAIQLARCVGPSTETSFTMMSVFAHIGGSIPALVVWTDDQSDAFASGTTVISRN